MMHKQLLCPLQPVPPLLKGENHTFSFNKQFILQEPLQNQPSVLLVLVHVPGEDEDVTDKMMWSVTKMSQTTSLARAWNIAGEFVRPKGITRYSKWPKGEFKAVFHSSPSLMQIRWQALCWKRQWLYAGTQKAESMRGSGHLFFIVMSFRHHGNKSRE